MDDRPCINANGEIVDLVFSIQFMTTFYVSLCALSRSLRALPIFENY